MFAFILVAQCSTDCTVYLGCLWAVDTQTHTMQNVYSVNTSIAFRPVDENFRITFNVQNMFLFKKTKTSRTGRENKHVLFYKHGWALQQTHHFRNVSWRLPSFFITFQKVWECPSKKLRKQKRVFSRANRFIASQQLIHASLTCPSVVQVCGHISYECV